MPPSPTRGCAGLCLRPGSTDFIQDLVQQFLSPEKIEVFPHFCHINRIAIGSQESARPVDLIGTASIGEQINVLSSANHLVRGQRQTADQCEAHAEAVEVAATSSICLPRRDIAAMVRPYRRA